MGYKGYSSYIGRNILKDLNRTKVTVSVPTIALLSDEEVTYVEEPSYFINGAPVPRKSKYGNKNTIKTTYTADPISYVDGEPVKSSSSNRTTAYLPLSTVIDIHYKGFSIYMIDEHDILTAATLISDILDRLDNSIDGIDMGTFEYIEMFYDKILREKADTINNVMSTRNNFHGSKVIGFTNDLMGDNSDPMDFLDINDVLVK